MFSVCVCVQTLRAELEGMRGKVECVRELGQDLMSTRGEHCQATVRPRLEQLNQRFEIVTQRISSGLVTHTHTHTHGHTHAHRHTHTGTQTYPENTIITHTQISTKKRDSCVCLCAYVCACVCVCVCVRVLEP